ncbi:MAG: hypothetical protein ABSE58_12860 [Candidatus Limnocylindrales bacterium]
MSGPRARTAALRELLAAAQERSGRVNETRSEPWAIRYLQAGRPTSVLARAPSSPADGVKLAHLQADQIVGVIRAVLNGLDLSEEEWERGIKIAQDALRAAATQGWAPL